jgi:hypothetical protein
MDPRAIYRFLASLRLTVVCLGFATVLVFVGTLAQVDIGLYAAQAKYFQSVFVFWTLPGTPLRIPVLPGGYLVGGVLVVNLLCAHFQRFGWRRDKTGLLMVHAGLILLLLGQLATDLLSRDSSMRLSEGEEKNYAEDGGSCELAVVDTSGSGENEVVAIPESYLARHREIRHKRLPFVLKVHPYWPNSTNVPPALATGPSLATQGAGRELRFAAAPAETRMDRRNMPTAYIEPVVEGGKSLGLWAVSFWLNAPQAFTHAGKTYELALRPERRYFPFALQLAKFSHDRYMGTDIPKNFSSDVRVINRATGEDRQVRIYMNNPLRYGGETFYQSGFDEHDPRVTILQVVRNPGWLTPYVSCGLVGLGLAWQFLVHLFEFLKRRSL